MAAKRRHWKEKDGRYWARLAIPEQLRPLFGNKTQLTEPLGGDLKVADRNHAAAVARLQARLEAARGSMTAMKAHVAREAELRPLDPNERDEAAWDRYSTLLAEIEKKRATMPTASEIRSAYEETMQRVEAGEAGPDRPISSRYNLYADYEIKAGARHFDATLRQRRLAALRSALPAGETTLVDSAVRDYADLNGLDVPPDGPDWQALAEAFMRAEIEALQRSIEYDNGEMGGQPTDPMIRQPAAAKAKANSVPLKTLFEAYITSRQAAGYHQDGGANWEQPINALIKFLGHSDASRITRLDLLNWRDSLLTSGLSAKTVADKHLAAVRAVLTWGFDNAQLPTNEAEKVKQDVPKKVRAREAGYTDKEAVQILIASRDYQPKAPSNPSNRESAHITAAKRWIPLLCAFTGARVTEMTQLRKEDVRQEGGRWIIRITPDAGSVKSGEYRDVPLHRQVVALGFIDFVKAAQAGPMFHRARSPEKYLANARATSGKISEWLNDLGLVPKGVAPSYGWRHRFKTQGRDLGMSDRVLDAIQGHPGRKASDNYGDVTIKARLRMIDALPEYDLTTLPKEPSS